jgi:hypothetical protein
LTSAVTAVSVALLAISELTAATTKQNAPEEGRTNNNDSKDDHDSSWGRNRSNPALAGGQERMPKKQKN